MFGYIRPYFSEMKIREYEKYRAAYCGLCRAMGQVTGQLSRLTLSYDLVFLAAVRLVLCGIEPEFEAFRCAAHAAKKRLVMKPNEVLDYTAAFSAVLAEAKNSDDLADEKGIKRCRAIICTPEMKRMARLAGLHLNEEAALETASRLSVLSGLELSGCTSADETAQAFGAVLSYAFSLGLDGENRELASKIGMYTGRFIYMCDAADDMTEDIKKKRYNPLAAGWGDMAVENGAMSQIVRESVMTSTLIDLERLGEAVELLDQSHVMTPIIKNIVYLGLPASMRKVLFGAHDDDGREERIGLKFR